ncbi:hypothetical protein LG329_05560 [Virgibacillus necropolis]|uniref:hypothetical protein n=1 Tax=Virgibacillus necropolis TaxID=163877 RepID=UPI00384D2C2E
MEKQIEVMKQSAELLDTVYEGLQHMQQLLKEGKFEETIPLFGDIVYAFSTIENSVSELPDEILSDDSKALTTKVRNALDHVVGSYESKEYGKVQEVLQFTLMPSYRKWMEELDEAFRSFLVS